MVGSERQVGSKRLEDSKRWEVGVESEGLQMLRQREGFSSNR